ncbi:RNA polymerase sigma factor [Spirosoma rhododendri]|uniref:Sigma-70 family RNA polymerase sigma factor n=1 Tax=Spirosoma rhododendri TaxID=2728024 RepID=A0A7L5DI66_9BACT|nr:sigma-70 family RNA polymerase sigma factor [Spirosoma rhododendri]QJD78074.1 sigma-70 family RNA polymerase sigma factor [Spirosoma rhododendri]
MFLRRFRKPKPAADPADRPAELLAQYRATGDVALLGELYEPYMELVYAVCYKYLRDEEEAKDAVMQLFEQLVVDLRRHEVQQFLPWLHSVSRNYCLMLLRRRQGRPQMAMLDSVLADEDESALTSTVDEPDREEDLSRMEACLQTLPIEQRTCLTLFYLEKKSYADVSEQTGYDLKQVKSYLQNGRRKLKLCLSDPQGISGAVRNTTS